MCSQCLTEAESFGQILPPQLVLLSENPPHMEGAWYLMRATKDEYDHDNDDYWMKGEWGLVQSNNPSCLYNGQFYDSHEEEEKHFESLQALDDALDSMDVMTSYKFVAACKRAGYNPEKDGHRVASWFMDHAANYLKTAKSDHESS